MRSRLMQGACTVNDTDRLDSKQDYYARREAQERALAERAADSSARYVHRELASRYADIITRIPAA